MLTARLTTTEFKLTDCGLGSEVTARVFTFIAILALYQDCTKTVLGYVVTFYVKTRSFNPFTSGLS